MELLSQVPDLETLQPPAQVLVPVCPLGCPPCPAFLLLVALEDVPLLPGRGGAASSDAVSEEVHRQDGVVIPALLQWWSLVHGLHLLSKCWELVLVVLCLWAVRPPLLTL